jgi:hypothetical protein
MQSSVKWKPSVDLPRYFQHPFKREKGYRGENDTYRLELQHQLSENSKYEMCAHVMTSKIWWWAFSIYRQKSLHTLNGEDVILLKSSCRAEDLATIDSAVLGFNICDPVWSRTWHLQRLLVTGYGQAINVVTWGDCRGLECYVRGSHQYGATRPRPKDRQWLHSGLLNCRHDEPSPCWAWGWQPRWALLNT